MFYDSLMAVVKVSCSGKRHQLGITENGRFVLFNHKAKEFRRWLILRDLVSSDDNEIDSLGLDFENCHCFRTLNAWRNSKLEALTPLSLHSLRILSSHFVGDNARRYRGAMRVAKRLVNYCHDYVCEKNKDFLNQAVDVQANEAVDVANRYLDAMITTIVPILKKKLKSAESSAVFLLQEMARCAKTKGQKYFVEVENTEENCIIDFTDNLNKILPSRKLYLMQTMAPPFVVTKNKKKNGLIYLNLLSVARATLWCGVCDLFAVSANTESQGPSGADYRRFIEKSVIKAFPKVEPEAVQKVLNHYLDVVIKNGTVTKNGMPLLELNASAIYGAMSATLSSGILLQAYTRFSSITKKLDDDLNTCDVEKIKIIQKNKNLKLLLLFARLLVCLEEAGRAYVAEECSKDN